MLHPLGPVVAELAEAVSAALTDLHRYVGGFYGFPHGMGQVIADQVQVEGVLEPGCWMGSVERYMVSRSTVAGGTGRTSSCAALRLTSGHYRNTRADLHYRRWPSLAVVGCDGQDSALRRPSDGPVTAAGRWPR